LLDPLLCPPPGAKIAASPRDENSEDAGHYLSHVLLPDRPEAGSHPWFVFSSTTRRYLPKFFTLDYGVIIKGDSLAALKTGDCRSAVRQRHERG
jgi:hypothetical protein